MLVVGAVLGSAAHLRGEPELVDGVQAVVHESVVTFFDVQSMASEAEKLLYNRYRAQPEVFLKKLADAREESLGQLIERQLILHDFRVTFSQP